LSGSAPDTLLLIHQRLLQGDKTASESLVRECLFPLVRVLRRRHLAVPRDMLTDAACDSLLALIQSPHRFDPLRSSLMTFLTLVADRRLVDHLRVAGRHAAREIHVGGSHDVEDWSGPRLRGEACRPHEPVAADRLPSEFEDIVAKALPDPRDRALLALICEGRRTIGDYAAVLGITHLSVADQRITIKRSRDRVLNRLRRRREAFRQARSWRDE